MRGQDDMNPIVIIGSGLSGYTVASEYRKLDQQRDMLLISQDDGSAYAKPILSNALAQNKSLEQLTSTPAEEMARRLNMTVLTRQTVLAIDARLQTIRTSSGELFYGDLVLALGADTVRLAIAGDGVQNMLSVNDLADYARFRAIIEGTRRILIMGAGLIGCEFANDLLHGGICPIVVDPNPWPLASLAPMAVGTALMQDLETAGVQWQLGNKVQRIDRAAQGYAVTLMDGTQLEVDAVLSAVGLKPRTTLAQAAGIATDKGILVNRYGQASSRRTYALGDCAQYTNGTLMPFVRPALIAARAIAATLAGSLSPIEFPSMPIMIKTPAHPVVVQPPHPATQGEWSQQFHTDGQQWLFRDNDQRLLGFAVSGGAAKSHARLMKLLGSVWTEA